MCWRRHESATRWTGRSDPAVALWPATSLGSRYVKKRCLYSSWGGSARSLAEAHSPESRQSSPSRGLDPTRQRSHLAQQPRCRPVPGRRRARESWRRRRSRVDRTARRAPWQSAAHQHCLRVSEKRTQVHACSASLRCSAVDVGSTTFCQHAGSSVVRYASMSGFVSTQNSPGISSPGARLLMVAPSKCSAARSCASFCADSRRSSSEERRVGSSVGDTTTVARIATRAEENRTMRFCWHVGEVDWEGQEQHKRP